jgi:hypothetical protein
LRALAAQQEIIYVSCIQHNAFRPFKPFAFGLLKISGRLTSFRFDFLSVRRQVVILCGGQSHFSSSRIKIDRVFNYARKLALLVPIQHRPIHLGFVFIESNPID